MYKLFELSPGARLDIARSGIKTCPGPTNHLHPSGSIRKLSLFVLCSTFALCTAIAGPPPPPASTVMPLNLVNLGSAAPFAVFGASGVTNTGKTVITGNLGVYPIAGTAVTGFKGENAGGPGVVIGTIDDNDTGPETTAAQHAAASLGIAINDAKGRPCTPCTLLAGDLSGMTLTPGLYKSTSTLALTGNLTLSGKGVYIFQIASGLTINVSSQVHLTNGAQAQCVFWQVGSAATLSGNVIFEGTIMAGSGVTFGSGTTLTGRALSQTNVTFIADTVTLPSK